MELSFELPHNHLKTLGEYNDYNFTLAHLTANEEYTSHYRESNKYTICDNSNFELKSPLPAPAIVRAADLFKAQEIIAPDSFKDGNGTIKATEEFIKYLEDSGKLGKFRVQGVVQGANVPDWTLCLDYMTNNKHIDVVGFSYQGCSVFAPDLANARIAAVALATHESSGDLKKTIHLLGVGGNPKELAIQNNVETIRSCDTSIPIVQGLYNSRLSDSFGLVTDKLPRPEDYFDLTMTDAQLKNVIHNISVMKNWVKK